MLFFSESQENNHDIQETEQDESLRDALTVLGHAVEAWIEKNMALEPTELQRRLQELVDETLEQNKALAAIEDDDEEDGDSVSEYGLGKKLKKWKNKAKKALVNAAKVVAINKAVGAAASALG